MSALLVSCRNLSFYFDCYYNKYFISSVDSAVLLKNEEDFSITKEHHQPCGQQLVDSIFGEDSDTDPENNSLRESANLNTQIAGNSSVRESANLNTQIAIPFNFQILTAKTSAENGTLITEEVMRRLDENYKRAKDDFQLSIETILRYLEYNMSFKNFFLLCESAPYTLRNVA